MSDLRLVVDTSADAPCDKSDRVSDPANPGGSFLEKLRNIRETLLLIGFFGGLVVWFVNYFATQEKLDQLTCETRVNTRILQATVFINTLEEQIRDTNADLQLDQKVLDRLKDEQKRAVNAGSTAAHDEILADDVAKLQKNVDLKMDQLSNFKSSIAKDNAIGAWGSEALKIGACAMAGSRDKINDRLSSEPVN